MKNKKFASNTSTDHSKKSKALKSLILIKALFLLILSYSALAKVEPKNYDFKLETLLALNPGSDFDPKQNQFKNTELIEQKEKISKYRLEVDYLRYRFPVFIQVREGKILDFYAVLPSYFLHDIFHQSIINRFGKQDRFQKKNGHALYIWKNKAGVDYYYAGTCTITCFPIFFSAQKSQAIDASIREELKNSSPQ